MNAPDAAGRAGDVVLCRGKHCFARIRWALTTGGSWMAVDPDPRPDGNLVWTRTDEGHRLRVLGKAEEVPATTRRFMAHWATCPDSVLFKVQKVFPDATVVDPGIPEAPMQAAPARRPVDPAGGLFSDPGQGAAGA